MRRSASEIIRELEMRVARLERQSSRASIESVLEKVGFRGTFTKDGDDLVFDMSEREFIREFQRAFKTRASSVQEMSKVLYKHTRDELHFVNPDWHDGKPTMGFHNPLYFYD